MARLSIMQAEPPDDWEEMEKERQTSTALPIGNAVDLEAAVKEAGPEAWIGDGDQVDFDGSQSTDDSSKVGNGGNSNEIGASSSSSSSSTAAAAAGLSLALPPPLSANSSSQDSTPPKAIDPVGGETSEALLGERKATSQVTKTAITLEDFEVLRVIGKGSFGKVFLVQRRDEKGTIYAMKVLKKDFVKQRRQIEHTRTERKVLGTVRHPFIVAMHFAFQTPSKLYVN